MENKYEKAFRSVCILRTDVEVCIVVRLGDRHLRAQVSEEHLIDRFPFFSAEELLEVRPFVGHELDEHQLRQTVDAGPDFYARPFSADENEVAERGVERVAEVEVVCVGDFLVAFRVEDHLGARRVEGVLVEEEDPYVEAIQEERDDEQDAEEAGAEQTDVHVQLVDDVLGLPPGVRVCVSLDLSTALVSESLERMVVLFRM